MPQKKINANTVTKIFFLQFLRYIFYLYSNFTVTNRSFFKWHQLTTSCKNFGERTKWASGDQNIITLN